MQLGQMVGKHTWNGVGNIVICDNIQLLKHDPFSRGGGGGRVCFPSSHRVWCVCVCVGGGVSYGGWGLEYPPELLKFSMVLGMCQQNSIVRNFVQDCIRSNLRRSKNQNSWGACP